MNATIVVLTLRQVLGRRRSLLMVLAALVPVLIGLIFAWSGSESEDHSPERFAATILLGGLVVNAVLPIVALVFGTSVLGSEIDEGTAVYLLSKPLSRGSIVLSKLLVSWAATAVVVAPSAAAAGLVALKGSDPEGIVPAFVAAIVLGSLAYSCVFVLLSILTSRALIVGLLYVFIWEGIVTNLFSGTRLLSIREFVLAIADALTRVNASDFEANLGPAQGVVLLGAVVFGATLLAVRELERFEVGEAS